MKTALTQLIEQLEKTIPEIKNGNAIDKKFWLEKEKQQIINAHIAGTWDTSGIDDDNECAENYFKETFNL